uniref:hypothetical protein n=1 Tax=Acinetobacter indicus TaxID=756892 RepID=UPI001C07FDD5
GKPRSSQRQTGKELQYGRVSAAELVQAVHEMLSAAGVNVDVEKQSLLQTTLTLQEQLKESQAALLLEQESFTRLRRPSVWEEAKRKATSAKMNTSQSSIAGASQNNMESTNQSSKKEGSWKISRTRSMVVVLVVHVIKTRARRRRRRIRRRSTRTDTSTAIAAAATAIRSFHMHFSTTHRRMEGCEKGF